MAFGPIMQFRVGELDIELAPLEREAMQAFTDQAHGGGMQRHSVTRYLARSFAPTSEDEQEWYEKARKDKTTLLWGIWLIEGETRTLIGNSSLNGIGAGGHTPLMQRATSGSMIFRPEYWGKGIASGAHKARTWYAFTQLGIHRLDSAVLQSNKGSRKALERSGYTYTHTERNDKFSDGKLHHADYFECLNPLDFFWDQWWHGDAPTKQSLEARARTKDALEWATTHVTLP